MFLNGFKYHLYTDMPQKKVARSELCGYAMYYEVYQSVHYGIKCSRAYKVPYHWTHNTPLNRMWGCRFACLRSGGHRYQFYGHIQIRTVSLCDVKWGEWMDGRMVGDKFKVWVMHALYQSLTLDNPSLNLSPTFYIGWYTGIPHIHARQHMKAAVLFVQNWSFCRHFRWHKYRR